MHFLIVEDDVVSGTLLRNLLQEYGTAVSIMTGTEVLSTFEKAHVDQHPFDLICLDIMLPGPDGQSILKKIREWEEQHGILGLDGVKVIMITALNDRHNILEAFRSQCEGYIVKPITKDKVVEQLELLGCLNKD
jgi:two-component system, chemotaxis family, chemotaxis protein CheY